MKPLGIAVIMGEDLEETLGWAKDSGFHNCQLQLWDMSHLCREHAGYVKDLLEKLDMEVTGLWCGWHGPIKWDFAEGPSILGIVPPGIQGVPHKEPVGRGGLCQDTRS